jgi:hypothetical protein
MFNSYDFEDVVRVVDPFALLSFPFSFLLLACGVFA